MFEQLETEVRRATLRKSRRSERGGYEGPRHLPRREDGLRPRDAHRGFHVEGFRRILREGLLIAYSGILQ